MFNNSLIWLSFDSQSLVIILVNFIVLGNWTEQGIKNVAESPERVKAARKMVEKAGGKMQFFTTHIFI